jgi:hypothetical protein
VHVDGSGEAARRVELQIRVKRHEGETVEATSRGRRNSGISGFSSDFSSPRGNSRAGVACTNRYTLCTIRTTAKVLDCKAVSA